MHNGVAAAGCVYVVACLCARIAQSSSHYCIRWLAHWRSALFKEFHYLSPEGLEQCSKKLSMNARGLARRIFELFRPTARRERMCSCAFLFRGNNSVAKAGAGPRLIAVNLYKSEIRQ